MNSLFFTCIFLIFLCINCVNSEILDVSSPSVLETAQFATQEISKLSDSGIYETLKLECIKNADKFDGSYFIHFVLNLELSSPYFKSKLSSEIFQIVVMEHKLDHYRTLAIDRFPIMLDNAIEEFYIKRVKERRFAREQMFDFLESSFSLYPNNNNNIKLLQDSSLELDFADLSLDELHSILLD